MEKESRYERNSESVRRICETMGYKLIGFDPDWAIAPVEEQLPTNPLEMISNHVLGHYDNIPDEFMGRLALMMNFDWEFDMQEDDLKKSISQCDEYAKNLEESTRLRIELLEKTIAGQETDDAIKEHIENIRKDGEEYVNEIKNECGEKKQYFGSIIRLRERLRKWKGDRVIRGGYLAS